MSHKNMPENGKALSVQVLKTFSGGVDTPPELVNDPQNCSSGAKDEKLRKKSTK